MRGTHRDPQFILKISHTSGCAEVSCLFLVSNSEKVRKSIVAMKMHLGHHIVSSITERRNKKMQMFLFIEEKVITMVKVVWFVPWKTGDATMCKTVSTILLTHIFLSFKVLRFCFRTVRNHQYQIDDVFISNALLILKAAAVLP